MADSAFDPESFLGQEYKDGIDTKIIPIPVGDWQAQVENLKPRTVTQKDGQERLVLDVVWHILSDEVKKQTGMDKPTVRQSIFIDLNEQGAIDMSKGKNRQLGLLREAVGQNKSGKAWSPQDLVGQMATVNVQQRPNPDDPESPYSDVKRVAPA